MLRNPFKANKKYKVYDINIDNTQANYTLYLILLLLLFTYADRQQKITIFLLR